jgi:hypothetical protein
VNGFDLFISYVRAEASRVVDGAAFDVVSELKRALETHVHPDDRRRRFRVCTDIEDLELESTVSTAIRNKIESSTQILVICSHLAGTRPYVVGEIATPRWRQRVTLAPKSLPRLALAPDGRTLLVAYFGDSPDLFRWTWRVFGVDVWTR